MLDFLTQRMADANKLARRSGYTGAPVLGIAITLSFILVAGKLLGWPAAAIGVVVLCFFMVSYHRRESYAFRQNRPELLLTEETLVQLTEMQIDGNNANRVVGQTLPSPARFEDVRTALTQTPVLDGEGKKHKPPAPRQLPQNSKEHSS